MGRTCSYFYKEKALFGGFPTQEEVLLLESLGVTWFVDLTSGKERKTTPYTTCFNYIPYPITDQRVPSDIVGFVRFIYRLLSVIVQPNSEKVYIHCKGGHGRSGLVAATLLCLLEEISPDEAIRRVTHSHNQRSLMKAKWRRIGSPQTRAQVNFLFSAFQSVDVEFLLCGDRVITEQTVFQNIFEALKSRRFEEQRFRELLECKFSQHRQCREKLLQTGLCNLQCRSLPGVGTICMKIRQKLFENSIMSKYYE